MKLSLLHEMAKLGSYKATPSGINTYLVKFKHYPLGNIKALSPEHAVKKYINENPDFEGDKNLLFAEITNNDINFTKSDIKSITNPDTEKQISDWFNANQDQYTWHIVLSDNYDFQSEPDPDGITFVKTGNVGRDTLQPFMILHTTAHAVLSYSKRTPEYIKDGIRKWVWQLAGNKDSKPIPEHTVIDFMTQHLHFKSALNWQRSRKDTSLNYSRQQKVKKLEAASLEELLYDMLAIYIKNGKIKVEPNQYAEENVDSGNLARFKNWIEDTFREALDSVVGKIIMDE